MAWLAASFGGSFAIVGGVLGVSWYLDRGCAPYSPPDLRKWKTIQKVAHSILEAFRWICPRVTNYLFPKATVIMPAHPIANTYCRKCKKADWPFSLDCAWRENSSGTLKGVTLEPNEKVTSLHVAAGGGNALGIQLFIGLEADVNAEDVRGQTPAYWAAYFGKAATVAQLKLYGADLKHVDKRGKTPLRAAVKYDNRDCVDVLAAAHVDLNKKDGRGLTPLHLAAYLGRHNIYEKLVRYGADTTITDSTGRTPEQVVNDRWAENYRNRFFFIRWFSSPMPPENELHPWTLQNMIAAKKV